jgi:hypothetical protein
MTSTSTTSTRHLSAGDTSQRESTHRSGGCERHLSAQPGSSSPSPHLHAALLLHSQHSARGPGPGPGPPTRRPTPGPARMGLSPLTSPSVPGRMAASWLARARSLTASSEVESPSLTSHPPPPPPSPRAHLSSPFPNHAPFLLKTAE